MSSFLSAGGTLDHVTSPTIGVDALREMRTHRRRHRVQDMDWFEALYRVYLTAFLGGGAILWASGWVGDDPLSAASVENLYRHTPHVVGLVASVVVFLGLRSGAQGGPLSIESAEVVHALLAPVPRAAVLRRPAWQRLRAMAFAGALAGGTANQLLGRRVPDHPSLVGWAVWGALAGALIGAAWVVAALVVHVTHLPRLAATALGYALVGWQVAVFATGSDVSGPFDAIGSVSLWWHHVHPLDLVWVAGFVAVAAAALWGVGRLSLEALVRRSALVAQLRFAVTLQDLRTVILLRRSLGHEHMRTAPWFTVPSVVRRNIVVARGLRSLARFPLRRIVRMALASLTASVALVGAYRGTTPLVVVAGLAMFLLGLELVEPLSQEVDQPDRTDALPVQRSLLYTRHLIAPAVGAVPFVLLGAGVAVALEPGRATVPVALVLGLAAAGAGIGGATINAMAGAPDPVGNANQGLYLPPEMSGMGTVLRNAFPPAVAVLGCLPVIAVRESLPTPWANLLRSVLAVALLLSLVSGWVRQRDAIKQWFATAQRESRAGSSRSSTTGGF